MSRPLPVAGDVGTQITIPIQDESGAVVNLTTLTSATMSFLRPDGTQFTRAATVAGLPTAGQITYTLAAGDNRIGDDGVWVVQGHLVFPNQEFSTAQIRFQVSQNTKALATA